MHSPYHSLYVSLLFGGSLICDAPWYHWHLRGINKKYRIRIQMHYFHITICHINHLPNNMLLE